MKWKETGQFENPPVGSHVARCVQVIDLGTQAKEYKGEIKHERQVRIAYELLGTKMEGLFKPEVKGKPFMVGITKKQSLHQASGLRSWLQSWRGKKFTDEEVENYDPRKLVGAACRITLIETDSGGVYPDSICRLSPGEEAPKAVNPLIYFSLERDEFNMEVLKGLPEKMRDKITGSPEYAKLMAPEQEMPTDDSGSENPGERDEPF